MDKSQYQNILAIALKNAMNPSYDSFYASICRWFSREFSTPLREVEDYNEEYVLGVYFADTYENLMSDEDKGHQRLSEIRENVLAMFKPEIEEMKEANQIDDEDWVQEMSQAVTQDAHKNPPINPDLVENPNTYNGVEIPDIHYNLSGEGIDSIPKDE